jgi:hypothetical protein
MSIAETMMRNGVRWTPSDRNRLAGKMEIHRRLSLDNGRPSLYIFETCTNLIRTLGNIPTSKLNTEDVDTKAEDHAYDALRYMVMTRQSNKPTVPDILKDIKQKAYQPEDMVFGY